MYNFNFIVRESKANKKTGLAPIELTIVINGKRTYVQLPMKVTPKEFKEKMVFTGNSNDVLDYCNNVRLKLKQYINIMMENNTPITAEGLKEHFLNGGVKVHYLFDVIDEFIKYYRKKTSEECLKKYILVFDKFKKFIGNKDIKHIKQIDFEEFGLCLKCDYHFEDSTLYHNLSRLKTMITYAHNKNYTVINEMKFVTIKKSQKPVDYLTEEEVNKIVNKDFKNERIEKVKDLFLFQCETALAYADAVQITFADIKKEKEIFYVKKRRQKTGIEFFTILTPKAMEILKKYNFNLDIISNQKANAYLKEIADVCGIEKHLTTHTARHTAATRLLNSGYRLEIVSKILGHTNTKQTQHYAKLVDKTIIKEYEKLRIV